MVWMRICARRLSSIATLFDPRNHRWFRQPSSTLRLDLIEATSLAKRKLDNRTRSLRSTRDLI